MNKERLHGDEYCQKPLPGFEVPQESREFKEAKFRKFSPSFIEQTEESSPESVKAQVLGILGHGQYRITMAALREARKNNSDLQKVPIVAQEEFEEWKNSHQFFKATGRGKNRKRREGSVYSADFVEGIWYSTEASTLQRDASFAFSNMIDSKDFPPESDPKAIVNVEEEFRRNVDFGFMQWNMNGVFDYISYSSAAKLTFITEVKFVSNFELTHEKRVQAFLYTVMAKLRQRRKKSKYFPYNDLRIENIRFHYSVFQKWPIPKFNRIDASIRKEEKNWFLQEFFDYSTNITDQKIDEIQKMRNVQRQEYMPPFIPEEKDVLLPKQPRLIYMGQTTQKE